MLPQRGYFRYRDRSAGLRGTIRSPRFRVRGPVPGVPRPGWLPEGGPLHYFPLAGCQVLIVPLSIHNIHQIMNNQWIYTVIVYLTRRGYYILWSTIR